LEDWVKLHRRHFVRNLDDERYLEAFLVSAVAAILLLRFYLYLSGFPQVGGKGLHVAHTLWGGVLMVASLALVFNYLDQQAHQAAAIIGGAGFGIFIDELGKFITSDTNYFYQPSAAIIYIIFVVIYLVFRLLRHERNVTDQEYLINSVQVFEQALIRGYDRSYIEKAVSRLKHAHGDTPLFRHLMDAYGSCPPETPTPPGMLQRARERSRDIYDVLVRTVWFPRVVILFFVIEAILTLLVAVIATWRATSFELVTDAGTVAAARIMMKQADVIFAAIASVLVILGALVMVRSRMDAYRMFKLAMLVSIFLTQIFEFYTIQFVALFGLAFNIVGLVLANTVMARERDRIRRQHLGPASSA
jgi:hypothetical protein